LEKGREERRGMGERKGNVNAKDVWLSNFFLSSNFSTRKIKIHLGY